MEQGEIINGSGYYIFFSLPGPDVSLKDAVNLGFSLLKSICSDKCYYFLNVGGNGKHCGHNRFIPI